MENQRQSRIELFRYNIILSSLFFLSSLFYLGAGLKSFDFNSLTFSAMSAFLTEEQLSVFNFLFFGKAALDLMFVLYVFKKFTNRINLLTKILWLLAVLSFGLIGFFPLHLYYYTHWFLAILMFFFWTILEPVMARATKSKNFIQFSDTLLFTQIGLILIAFIFQWINAVFETIYFLLVFLWLFIFINRYLGKE